MRRFRDVASTYPRSNPLPFGVAGFFFWASDGARSLLQLVGSSPSDDFAKDRMTSL